MIVEIAIATNTAPRDWWDEPEEILVTALDILDTHRKEIERRGRHR